MELSMCQQEKHVDSTKKLFVVEELPQFPGGETARIRFIRSNFIYPDSADKYQIEGTVYVSFIVSETGEIKDIQVDKGLGYGCDEAVVKMIRKMPKWIPGKIKGYPVNMLINMPVKLTYIRKK